jgi:hypothetical protein
MEARETPPREEYWQGDFHKYIQWAMSAEANGNFSQALACAQIATAFATAKVNGGDPYPPVNQGES